VPRTTMMTRPVKTMSIQTARISSTSSRLGRETWSKWEQFVFTHYGIPREGMSENHFFLYVVPKTVLLHGYGDPLLDPHIPAIVESMTKRRLVSYFSCNPANINMERTIRTFENGLGYIKYSMESVDDIATVPSAGRLPTSRNHTGTSSDCWT